MKKSTPMVPPRKTPDRDSKYMGEAWLKAAFSKDPSTQVGAVIVSQDNVPLGSGYNGPPRNIDDKSFSWERPPKDDPTAFSKYSVIRHAERNAIDHCGGIPLDGATLYCTALPCPDCMLDLVDESFARVVYFDFQSDKDSCLNNATWKEKSFKIAQLGRIRLEIFKGNLGWMPDWLKKLADMGIFDIKGKSE